MKLCLMLITIGALSKIPGVYAADVQANASFKVFYQNNARIAFAQVGSVTYSGTTFNHQNDPERINENYSDATWTGGVLGIGDLGSAVFKAERLDERHWRYILRVLPPIDGTMGEVSVIISGRDGYSRKIAPLHVTIPTQPGSDGTRYIVITAPVPPRLAGSSSLDPGVTRAFQLQNIRSAILEFESAADELRDHHHEEVDELKYAVVKELIKESLMHLWEKASEEVIQAVPVIGWILTADEAIKALEAAFVKTELVLIAKAAYKRLEETRDVAETLAQQTFLPETIFLTTTVQSARFFTIGGPAQRYRNDFRLAGDTSAGTSTFFDAQNSLLGTASITTLNTYIGGDIVHGKSSLILFNGAEFGRTAFRTGPVEKTSDGLGDFTYRFDTSFEFFPRLESGASTVEADTSFDLGLRNFSTRGVVSVSNNEPTQSTVTFQESDIIPSIATTTKIPPTEPILMVELRFPELTFPILPFPNLSFPNIRFPSIDSPFPPPPPPPLFDAEAILFIDFINNNITTPLIAVSSREASLRSEVMKRLFVFLPSQIRGQSGVIRFRLESSATDTIKSEAILGGFDIFENEGIPRPSTKPRADGGAALVLTSATNCLKQVSLDGNGSFDWQNAALTYKWSWLDGTATGVTPSVELPIGRTVVTLVVNNGSESSDPYSTSVTILPELALTRSGKTMVLRWPDCGFGLESSAAINESWVPVAQKSPFTIETIGRKAFYRLRQQLVEPEFPGLVFIPPGTFVMGSSLSEAERRPDESQHTVSLTKGFWMGKREVTQAEYLSVMGRNPSHFRNGVHADSGGTGGDVTNDTRHPVEQVSWIDATNYCGKLTQQDRTAGRIPVDYAYRLPTESEWEYACRAGTTNAFSFGNAIRQGMANFDTKQEYDSSIGSEKKPSNMWIGRTIETGSYAPNAFGLYDMHGNVWEWCSDFYGNYPTEDVIDPIGPPSGRDHEIRGGGYTYSGGYCRAALRFIYNAGSKNGAVGFRVVLAPGR